MFDALREHLRIREQITEPRFHEMFPNCTETIWMHTVSLFDNNDKQEVIKSSDEWKRFINNLKLYRERGDQGEDNMILGSPFTVEVESQTSIHHVIKCDVFEFVPLLQTFPEEQRQYRLIMFDPPFGSRRRIWDDPKLGWVSHACFVLPRY